MRIALGQLNTTVGDLRGNTDRMIAMAERRLREARNSLSFLNFPSPDILLAISLKRIVFSTELSRNSIDLRRKPPIWMRARMWICRPGGKRHREESYE